MSASGIVAEARKHIGYRFESYGSKFGRWYRQKYYGNSEQWIDSAAWCDMFVSYCADASGNASAVGHEKFVPYHIQQFKNKGKLLGHTSAVKAGDIVFFTWNGNRSDPSQGDHVGIVEKDAGPGQAVVCIEGNVTIGYNGVHRVTRNRNTIYGFGRPSYSGTEVPPVDPGKPSKPGKFIVLAGMTLSGIAAALGVSLSDLLSANPQIDDPNMIRPGDEINVPGDANDPIVPAPDPTPEPSPEVPSNPWWGDTPVGDRPNPSDLYTGPDFTHRVEAGDTLSSIADSYGVSLDLLIKYNPHIENPNEIWRGGTVHIPALKPVTGEAGNSVGS